MAPNKVRRVDFYHDEYIAGVGGTMSAENQGVYWMVCALIFSHGGEVENDPKRIGRLVCLGASKTRRIIAELVSTQKLSENGTKLMQKRAENELEKARKRIENASENGQKGGRPPKESNDLPEATGLNGGKLTTNHQPPTTNPKDYCSVQADTNFVIQDHDPEPSFAEPPFQPKPESAKAIIAKAGKAAAAGDLLEIPDFLDQRTPKQLPPGKFPTLKALGAGPARKYPAEFERFWATYPQRHTDTKAKAYIAWLKGVKAVGVDVLQSAAEAYANFCAAKDHPSKLVATWINAEGWTAEYGAVGGGNGGEAQTPYQAALAAWYPLNDAATDADPAPPKPRREDFVPQEGGP